VTPGRVTTSSGDLTAAVLAPVYRDGAGELRLVLIVRTEVGHHGGQLAFPGGRVDPADASLVATALREAEEEIGLPRTAVDVVGALTPTPTIATGYAIYPFVGVIEPGLTWTLSAREVAQVLEFSLRELRSGYRRRRLIRRGIPILTDSYTVGEHLIWGATARMLGDLLERIDRLEG
jgi:8-oxo-dGTP pyrophosphatase MutT (NUDIX family)